MNTILRLNHRAIQAASAGDELARRDAMEVWCQPLSNGIPQTPYGFSSNLQLYWFLLYIDFGNMYHEAGSVLVNAFTY